MNKILEQTIEQTQKTLEQSKDWEQTYEKVVEVLTENKTLLDQFYKQIKNYDYLQFHLVKVTPEQDNIFTVEAKYKGQPIATIQISKDKTTITTDDETNKKNFNCEIQLKDEDINSKETEKLMIFFNKEINSKVPIEEQVHTQAMLLKEFSKTSSYDKLLTGIQPIRYSNLYLPIPIIINNEQFGRIKILTRTKVRKLTIIEPLTEKQKPEMVLADATSQAMFLLNLLHTEKGQIYYKIMGFHGRVTPHLTIKVCLAVPKQLESKCKEFDPFELRAGTDSIEFYHLSYETDKDNITSIHTKLNS